jgi:hypothetical protein
MKTSHRSCPSLMTSALSSPRGDSSSSRARSEMDRSPTPQVPSRTEMPFPIIGFAYTNLETLFQSVGKDHEDPAFNCLSKWLARLCMQINRTAYE